LGIITDTDSKAVSLVSDTASESGIKGVQLDASRVVEHWIE